MQGPDGLESAILVRPRGVAASIGGQKALSSSRGLGQDAQAGEARRSRTCGLRARIVAKFSNKRSNDLVQGCMHGHDVPRELQRLETSMSRHTSTLTGAFALCLMVAGMAPVTRAQPLSSAKPQASPVIILAQRDTPGVPRGAVCVHWVPAHHKMKCQSWCFPRPGYKCQ